jgi:hypothetical protein
MRTQIKKTIACTAMAALLTSLLGCKCIRPVQVSSDGRLVILQEPQSQTVLTNSSVNFSVVAMHVGGPSTNAITYQWRFNTVPIAGATNSTYWIANASFADVGAYDVVVTGSSLTSQTAFLSVYSPIGNGGTLQTPIGAFTSQSVTCGGGTFQKGYSPTNSDGSLAFFYGPNASPQSGIFKNSTPGSNRLTVDTFSSNNGTVDTGLRLRNNWSPFAIADCNDNAAGGTDPRQSKAVISLSQNPGDPTNPTSMNSYRLTILYKDNPPPPPGVVITINWLYGTLPIE